MRMILVLLVLAVAMSFPASSFAAKKPGHHKMPSASTSVKPGVHDLPSAFSRLQY